jgi:hypothetical protein
MMEALTTLGQSFGGMVFLKSTLIVSLVFALSFLLRKASDALLHRSSRAAFGDLPLGR